MGYNHYYNITGETHMLENSSIEVMFMFLRKRRKIHLIVSCELLVETKYQDTVITVIHKVNVPAWD